MSKSKFVMDMDHFVNKLDSNYGILITKNNKVLYEKYVGNKKIPDLEYFLCQSQLQH